MLIKKLTVGRTFNLGNDRSLFLEIEADMESFDVPEQSATILHAKLDLMMTKIMDHDLQWIDEPTDSLAS